MAERNQVTRTAKEIIVTFGLPFLFYMNITNILLTHICDTFKNAVKHLSLYSAEYCSGY
jgi:hypothetical protein